MYMPQRFPAQHSNLRPRPFSSEKIYYYKFAPSNPNRALPRITSTGAGAHAGSGFSPDKLPMLGSTATHLELTIISKPLNPDNIRQTIHQPSAPPDVRITAELKLPNIVQEAPVQKPLPELHLRDLRPMSPNARSAPTSAVPVLTVTTAMVPNLAASSAEPQKPLPELHLHDLKPLTPNVNVTPLTAAPEVAVGSNAVIDIQTDSSALRKPLPELHLRDLKPIVSKAQIAAAGAAPEPEMSRESSAIPQVGRSQPRVPITGIAAPRNTKQAAGEKIGSGDPVGDPDGLMIIGVDPSGHVAELVLPGGNRWGEFLVSPAATQPGSPGGSLVGAPGGGSGGKTSSGDESTGVGPGSEGGGGGSTGSVGRVTVASNPGASSLDLRLDPIKLGSMVYPVPPVVVPRRNALVVSAGPRGGGGLEVYGVLPCGKIYTVFLPMPGGAWTLQFCRSGQTAAADTRSAVVHLEPTIIPPDPEVKFDFQRLSVPLEKARKLIVLKGSIREDGNVDKVEVYQGVIPQIDEAARLAFSKWKFKPAISQGNPLRIDILVGIPLTRP
jgi:hypothetical protein